MVLSHMGLAWGGGEIMGMSRPKDYPRKLEGSSLPAPWIPCVALGCTGMILGYRAGLAMA